MDLYRKNVVIRLLPHASAGRKFGRATTRRKTDDVDLRRMTRNAALKEDRLGWSPNPGAARGLLHVFDSGVTLGVL